MSLYMNIDPHDWHHFWVPNHAEDGVAHVNFVKMKMQRGLEVLYNFFASLDVTVVLFNLYPCPNAILRRLALHLHETLEQASKIGPSRDG